MNPNKKHTKDLNDEVEELLRAAEDAALLKLNLSSHTVHASPSDLCPDLEKRFRDLKSSSKSKAKKVSKMPPPLESTKANKEVEDDDLLARFASLKASLPKPSFSVFSSYAGIETSDNSVDNKLADGSSGGKAKIDDVDEDEDEVEKVIRWAMDAARLDPSPPSDDDSINDDSYDDNETSDEDALSCERNPKGQRK